MTIFKTKQGRAARLCGYEAEEAACAWLIAQGLRVIERNVRYPFGELDIVAWHQDGKQLVLVVFEVRLRSNQRYGSAEDSITPSKQRRLWAAAQAYAAQFKPQPLMRIDVLAYNSKAQIHQAPTWLRNICS